MSIDEFEPADAARRTRPESSTSSATRTSRSRPRSTGSSPTRSTPVGCCPAPGSPPVRELGAALRVNPNTIRAVYRRLADAGYVTSRHGAGTHVADRPPQRRGAEALAGIVAEMLRRAAAGRLHAPTRSPRPRSPRPPSGSGPGALGPGPVRRVHERRRRLRRRAAGRRVPRPDRGRGHAARRPARPARAVPLRPRRDDDVPRRRGPGARPRPACRSWRCSSGPATSSSSTRSPALPAGLAGRARLRVGARRGEHGRDARAVRDHAASSCSAPTMDADDGPRPDRPDRRPDPPVARGARERPRPTASPGPSGSARGRTSSTRPGLELLRRAIEHAAHGASSEAVPAGLTPEAPSLPVRGIRCGRGIASPATGPMEVLVQSRIDRPPPPGRAASRPRQCVRDIGRRHGTSRRDRRSRTCQTRGTSSESPSSARRWPGVSCASGGRPGRRTSSTRTSGRRASSLVERAAAARRLAARLNERAAGGAPTAHAGEIVALGLLHEVGHVLVDRYERDVRPARLRRRARASSTRSVGTQAGRRRPDAVRGGVRPGARTGGPPRGAAAARRRRRRTRRATPLRPLVDPGPVAQGARPTPA